MKKKTIKCQKTSANTLKKAKKKIQHMKETIQDLKTEIEIAKKTKVKGIIGTEIMKKQSETRHTSVKTRIQEMKEKISTADNTIEEADQTVKENIKSNKSLTKSIQVIWNNRKTPNLIIIGIEEVEVKLKSTEHIFNKIIEENFPNLKKDMPINI